MLVSKRGVGNNWAIIKQGGLPKFSMTQITRFLTSQKEANCGVVQKISDEVLKWYREGNKGRTQEEKNDFVEQFYQLSGVFQYFVDSFTDDLYESYKIKREKCQHRAWE